MARVFALLAGLSLASAQTQFANNPVKVGTKVPAIELDYGFPPEKVDLAKRVAGKKVILVGLPGAFTPTCSSTQVPGYLEKQDELKAKGIDEVLVYCVNDGAVMSAWAEAMGVEGSMITFLADTRSELTQALGVVLDHPGPMGVLGNPRSKRFAMYLDDGEIKVFNTSEKPDDPAGDDFPETSCVDNMLDEISKLV